MLLAFEYIACGLVYMTLKARCLLALSFAELKCLSELAIAKDGPPQGLGLSVKYRRTELPYGWV